ncbi:MAG: pyridoxal phosphate-dependent aminotransferase, partial [Candidatus Adiutrix sp.]
LKQIIKLADDNTRLVFIDNPLNPTGAYLEPDELMALYEALPHSAILILDEAYIEFTSRPRPDYLSWLKKANRLIIMRTFSKAYGLAGLRAAYAVMPPDLAEAINKIRQPFNMNVLSQVGAVAALKDDDFLKRTIEATRKSLNYYVSELTPLNLKVTPSEANFVMVTLPTGILGDDVFQALMARGIIVRSLSPFGLMNHLRINAGTESESLALVTTLKDILASYPQ